MTDMEKVMRQLEECLPASCRGFRTCPYSDTEWDAVRAAYELLKEQKSIVHCKDCKYAMITSDSKLVKYCEQWGDEELYLDADFFCANGEVNGDD